MQWTHPSSHRFSRLVRTERSDSHMAALMLHCSFSGSLPCNTNCQMSWTFYEQSVTVSHGRGIKGNSETPSGSMFPLCKRTADQNKTGSCGLYFKDTCDYNHCPQLSLTTTTRFVSAQSSWVWKMSSRLFPAERIWFLMSLTINSILDLIIQEPMKCRIRTFLRIWLLIHRRALNDEPVQSIRNCAVSTQKAARLSADSFIELHLVFTRLS